jgi:exodeoxyribonuclease VII large subunit
MAESDIYSVSDITHIIKLLIEENIPTIWVEGEISNFKPHYSGHYYFTLKDSAAQISAVIWKSRAVALPFMPEDGMLVQALGNIRLYEKSGRYQLDVIRMQPAGIGRLQMEFERLKQKLEAEGLFDTEHKKPIPVYPSIIGIVTSATGAALQDILQILKRRAPQVQIIVRPTQVQGESAAREIAAAIEEFNDYGRVDLLIVGRGGGSLEDLWPFNEEIVARAIFRSHVPIISAVGHEIDFTIADFVADMRAPTPSAAAELATPDRKDLTETLLLYRKRMVKIMSDKLQYYKQRIHSVMRSYGFRRPADILKQYALMVDDLANQLEQNYIRLIKLNKDNCNQLQIRLVNLDPKNVLKRGYSISYVGEKIIRNIDEIATEDEMRTELQRGQIISLIKKIKGA